MSIARVTMFNNLLHDVVQLISEKFPEDKDVEWTRSQIEFYTSVSSLGAVTNFMQSARPHLKQILEKDDVFFISMANKQDWLAAMCLEDKWSSLSIEDKEALWRKIQKMVVLGDKILNSTNSPNQHQ